MKSLLRLMLDSGLWWQWLWAVVLWVRMALLVPTPPLQDCQGGPSVPACGLLVLRGGIARGAREVGQTVLGADCLFSPCLGPEQLGPIRKLTFSCCMTSGAVGHPNMSLATLLNHLRKSWQSPCWGLNLGCGASGTHQRVWGVTRPSAVGTFKSKRGGKGTPPPTPGVLAPSVPLGGTRQPPVLLSAYEG